MAMVGDEGLIAERVTEDGSRVRWFSTVGCVIWEGQSARVYVGGTLVGQFVVDEPVSRDVLLVGLARDPSMHLGHLARAFDLSSEMLRRIRRRFEA